MRRRFYDEKRDILCGTGLALLKSGQKVLREGVMRTKIFTILTFAIFLIAFIPSAHAADQSRVIRLRDVEGDVTMHPSDSQRPQDATMNMPVLDGDELETQEGRAELAFRNGIVVRVGDDSRIRIESAYSPMKIELEQGTLFVDSHLVDSFRDTLEVLAGDAQVYLIDEGNMRVDMGTEGSVRVTTLQGEAEVRANGRRVLVENGERTYVDPGSAPEQAEAFNSKSDDLDDWNESRMEQYADRGNDQDQDRYLDDDMYYDGSELNDYGDWRAYGSYGHVWVPRVDQDWRPYYDGRWTYGNGGWFWVSSEPWGWAPYHYGRWGFAFDIGWYWIPGDVFAPAWVSWYDYGDYIGWCPLNFYNRPVYYFNFNYYNLPRVQKQRTLDAGNSWNFVKKQDLGSPSLRKVVLPPTDVRKIRIDETKVIHAPQSQLVNYVIPKSRVPAYVNDKRVIKQPEDIQNPVGINHREEQFGHTHDSHGEDRGAEKRRIPSTSTPAVTKHHDEQFARGTTGGRDHERDGDNVSTRVERKPYGNRDSQFTRENEGHERQSRSYVSPYYRERDREVRERDQNERNADPMLWYRQRLQEQERNNNDDEDRNISPRYGDEARRIFEHFDQSRRESSRDNSNNSRDSRPPEQMDRPEPPRHDNGSGRPSSPPPQQQHSNSGHGNNGNNGSHGGSKPDHH
jgi:FecR protein